MADLVGNTLIFGALTVSGTSETSSMVGGDLALSGLSLSGTLTGGALVGGALNLSSLSASGTMLAGNAMVGDITLPSLAVEGSTGTRGDIQLPGLELSATMVAGQASVSATLNLPAYTLEATLLSQGLLTGDCTLPGFTLSGTASASGVLVGVLELPGLTLAATALNGQVATASLTLPMYEMTAGAMGPDVVGTAVLNIPVYQLSGTMISAIAVPTFSGVVLNTRLKAASTYADVNANSVASFNGVTLLATADGIVALTGDTDQGAEIDAHIKSATSDLGTAQDKRVLCAYLSYRADGDMEMTVITDDHHEHVYPVVPRRIDQQHPTRAKFGRGVAGMYWQWKLANKNGADFAVDAVELEAIASGRKL